MTQLKIFCGPDKEKIEKAVNEFCDEHYVLDVYCETFPEFQDKVPYLYDRICVVYTTPPEHSLEGWDFYKCAKAYTALKKDYDVEAAIRILNEGLEDQLISEELWEEVDKYCENDIIATAELFSALNRVKGVKVMKQIKIFSGRDKDKIEKEVNDFCEEHYVVDVDYESYPICDGKRTYLYDRVCVVYTSPHVLSPSEWYFDKCVEAYNALSENNDVKKAVRILSEALNE